MGQQILEPCNLFVFTADTDFRTGATFSCLFALITKHFDPP